MKALTGADILQILKDATRGFENRRAAEYAAVKDLCLRSKSSIAPALDAAHAAWTEAIDVRIKVDSLRVVDVEVAFRIPKPSK